MRGVETFLTATVFSVLAGCASSRTTAVPLVYPTIRTYEEAVSALRHVQQPHEDQRLDQCDLRVDRRGVDRQRVQVRGDQLRCLPLSSNLSYLPHGWWSPFRDAMSLRQSVASVWGVATRISTDLSTHSAAVVVRLCIYLTIWRDWGICIERYTTTVMYALGNGAAIMSRHIVSVFVIDMERVWGVSGRMVRERMSLEFLSTYRKGEWACRIMRRNEAV